MKYLYISLIIGFWLAFNTPGTAQIIGRVHQAQVSEKNKEGLAKLVVRAYDRGGQLITSSYTDATGHYQLNLATGQRVRLEFAEWPQGFSPAPGQAKVQFVTSPAEVNLALWQPGQYVGSNPFAVQSLYAGSRGRGDSLPALVGFPVDQPSPSKIATWATSMQAGALWGLAYERSSKRLFAAAFAKRHTAFGPLGSGGIYMIDTKKPVLQSFVDLDALGFPTRPDDLTRDLSDKQGVFSHDSLMFALVGKTGLGGLDISDDGQNLWTMNLYDRKLYRISVGQKNNQVPTAAEVIGFALPSSGRKGEIRPFAVKYYGGKVYVGVINDATGKATAADLRATILAFDPIREKFDEVFSTSLNYTRGTLDYDISGWRPWIDNYYQALSKKTNGWMIYPQPILADIEFDTDGSMILGLMDRLGHQTGEGQLYRLKGSRQLQQARGLAGGDVLRVALIPTKRGEKRYELESNGQAGDRNTSGKGNGEGPNGGEFYFDDAFVAHGVTWHHETVAGGLALLPDQEQVLVAVREPEPGGYLGGGLKWFSNRSGAAERSLSILPKEQANPFGKANNVGDIELITEVPPTEIGDRIWQDCDEDGIQDADEAPLGGVEVGLYRNGQLLATTITDTTGRYVFTDAMITGGLHPRTAYELRVSTKQNNYSALKLTTSHQGNDNELDNDAVLDEGYAVIKLETMAPGENLHHLDFGFLCVDKPQVMAQLACSSQTITLALSGQQPGDRFAISTNRQYHNNMEFDQANFLPPDGQVLSDQLAHWPAEMTVRIFNSTGCFSDLFIRQTDIVGCPQNGPDQEVAGLLVSPNPTSDYVLIRYVSLHQHGSIQVRITDIQGRPLVNLTRELTNGKFQTQLNLSQQPTGDYLVVVYDGVQRISQTVIKR